MNKKPVLWKYDFELGIAYFCPHCKTFVCSENHICPHCSEGIDWNQKEKYTGRVKWN